MGIAENRKSYGGKGKAGSTGAKTWQSEFIECPLSEEQKADLKSWKVDEAGLFDALLKLIDDGYKVSFAADDFHDAVAAFCSNPVNDTGVRTKTLSSRGPDLWGALKSLCYKHLIVLEGNWDNAPKKERVTDQWG